MSTITLPNIRVGSDLQVGVHLKDGGVAIDWSTLTNIKAYIYSDAQRSLAGRCSVTIDGEDPTLLVCDYAATKPQYLGVNRIIVSCTYLSETKTYDKPAFNFVRWTADQEGEEITIEDPDVEVEIEVEDVTSSILDEAVQAALSAAERAEAAAEEAEHMVDIHTGPEGKSAYEVAVEEGYTGTEEEWLASLKGPVGETPDISIGTVTTVEPGTPAAASMSGTPEAPVLNLSIPKGLVGATPNITVGTVTTGQPGTPVVITITGTAEAPVLNVTIPQGLKGDTGVSADYPITIHNGLDSDATDEALAAAQGKILDGKVSQLEAEVNTLSGWYYGVFAVEEDLPDDATRIGFAFVGGAEPLKLYDFDGEEWGDTGIEISGISGPQGVGIDTIEQTTTSTESEGQNVITITKTDGETATFIVRNGKRGMPGAQGQQGNPGSSIDYPFSLENSLSSTDTTKALTAAMGKILNDTKAGVDSDATDVDLKIMDEYGNILAEFVDGHFRVKYFDTKEINKNTVPVIGATADEDFTICDPLFNKLLILANGHIKTKYFDSSKLPIKAIRKAVFMGDSITQGVYSYWNGGVHTDANRYNGFDITNVSSVEQSTEFHGIHYYFEQFSGAEMVNLGKRGSGWVADTRNIGNALAVATSYNYSNVDFVALFFGVNDYIQGIDIGEIGQSGTVRGNMASVIQKIASDNPLCKIVVYSPYNTFGQVSKGGDYVASDTLYGNESTNYALGYDYQGKGTLSDYIAAIDDVCTYYGVQHVKLSASNVVNRLTIKNIMVDGLHPTKESYPMLAAEIYGKGNFGA